MADRKLNIVVTGTSRGIGQSIKEKLAGHNIVGHSSGGSDPDGVVANLAEAGGAAKLWGDALQRLNGRVDVLINNAGIYEAAPIESPDDEWLAAWARTLQVNLIAAADLCRHAVLHFQENGGGRIINMASRAAYRGDSAEHWHYAASKAGMIGMTKTLARAYATDNIFVYAVCPGFTMTGIVEDYLESRGGGAQILADIPLGRASYPEEVAETVRWLALNAPAAATGSVIDINGASFVR